MAAPGPDDQIGETERKILSKGMVVSILIGVVLLLALMLWIGYKDDSTQAESDAASEIEQTAPDAQALPEPEAQPDAD